MAVTKDTVGVEFLNISEAAQTLRISRSLVYQLIETGRLEAYRVGVGRGAIRISREDFLRFLESCRDNSGRAASRPPRRKEKLRHLKV